MPTVAKSTVQLSLISSQTMSRDRGSCFWPPTVNDLQRRAFRWRGGGKRRGRGEIKGNDHGFQCRAPTFVIGPLRVIGDLGYQPVAERIPRQAEPVGQRDRDRQGARLP